MFGRWPSGEASFNSFLSNLTTEKKQGKPSADTLGQYGECRTTCVSGREIWLASSPANHNQERVTQREWEKLVQTWGNKAGKQSDPPSILNS